MGLKETHSDSLIKQSLDKAMSYQEYRDLVH